MSEALYFAELSRFVAVAQRQLMTESYIHYLAAQREFDAQTKIAAGPEELLTQARQKRLRGIKRLGLTVDRIQLARKYTRWVADRKAPGVVTEDGKAAGRLTDKITCTTNKAEIIRRSFSLIRLRPTTSPSISTATS